MKKYCGIFLLILLVLLISTGCSSSFIDNYKDDGVTSFSEDHLRVNYIDVGQGDSIFVELPNNQAMLIDAGESYMGDRVVNYIKNIGIKKIDYIVGTHPHTDHIGGLEQVINSFDVGTIYLPKVVSNTKTYEDLLNTISNKGLSVTNARNGVYVIDEDNLKIEFVAPNSDSYDNLNNYSAIVKLTYYNTSFLFMGDAETLSENEIKTNVSSDVIKVGHHGSDSSSSLEFVKKVNPSYAIIMVGESNSYNHPYQSIIDRYQSIGSKVLRTDLDGNISCDSDGNKVNCNGDKESNSNSNKPSTSNISLVNLTSPVSKGNNATISIKGIPNTLYDIDVMYSSGESKASGLEDKTSDSEGNVSWNFKVSSNVKIGVYDVIISDGDNSVTYSLEVVN